jgi:hypothetical protein
VTASVETLNRPTEKPVVVTADTLYKLLDKAVMLDTLDFDNEEPFLFLKSGHFLSKTEKNSILVTHPTDTTYFIRLYTQRDNKWVLNDSIDRLFAFTTQFDLVFDDYNFDKQTDIYMQVSASNGRAMSRGHLLTIDPKTKKLIEHKEARQLANMKPDSSTKTVTSEVWLGWDTKDKQHMSILTNKWVNGRLQTVKKKTVEMD